MMKAVRVVVDTNVLISALRSRRGASFKLLGMIDDKRLRVILSVPLFLEYEDVAKRLVKRGGLRIKDVDAILSYVAAIAEARRIHYLWRPLLRDPKDDMLLEVAVAGNADAIITFNKRDFEGIDLFNIDLMTPQELLRKLGEIK